MRRYEVCVIGSVLGFDRALHGKLTERQSGNQIYPRTSTVGIVVVIMVTAVVMVDGQGVLAPFSRCPPAFDGTTNLLI